MSEQNAVPNREQINAAMNVIKTVCSKAPLINTENTEMKQAVGWIDAVCRDHDRLLREAAEAAIAAVNAAQANKNPKLDEPLVDGNTVKSISVEVSELQRLADLDEAAAKAADLTVIKDIQSHYHICSVSRTGVVLNYYDYRTDETVFWVENAREAYHFESASFAAGVLTLIEDIYEASTSGNSGITYAVFERQGDQLTRLGSDDYEAEEVIEDEVKEMANEEPVDSDRAETD